jgi:hypothetical protein
VRPRASVGCAGVDRVDHGAAEFRDRRIARREIGRRSGDVDAASKLPIELHPRFTARDGAIEQPLGFAPAAGGETIEHRRKLPQTGALGQQVRQDAPNQPVAQRPAQRHKEHRQVLGERAMVRNVREIGAQDRRRARPSWRTLVDTLAFHP